MLIPRNSRNEPSDTNQEQETIKLSSYPSSTNRYKKKKSKG